MALGGALAISDRRYRVHSRKAKLVSEGNLPTGGAMAAGGKAS
jgi:hypothetical protein